MDVHIRLKQLRRTLKLSARAFGESINMSGGAISNMEVGRRAITDRTINDICREHNVNPDWLLNGEEPIFNDVFAEMDLHEEVKELAEIYAQLSERNKMLIRDLIDSLSEKPQKNSSDEEQKKSSGEQN